MRTNYRVIAVEDIPLCKGIVPKGTEGTVVWVYRGGWFKGCLTVEFDNGLTTGNGISPHYVKRIR